MNYSQYFGHVFNGFRDQQSLIPADSKIKPPSRGGTDTRGRNERTTIVIEILDVIENIPLQILEGMIGPSVGPFLLEIFEKGFAGGDIYPVS